MSRILALIVLSCLSAPVFGGVEDGSLYLRFETHFLAQVGTALDDDPALRQELEVLTKADLESLAARSARFALRFAYKRAESHGNDPEKYYSRLGFEADCPYLGHTSLEDFALFLWMSMVSEKADEARKRAA